MENHAVLVYSIPWKKQTNGVALYVKGSANRLSSWIGMDMDHLLLEYKNTDIVLLSHCKVKTSCIEDTTFEMDKWIKETRISEQGSNYFNYMHINWSNSKKGIKNKFLLL